MNPADVWGAGRAIDGSRSCKPRDNDSIKNSVSMTDFQGDPKITVDMGKMFFVKEVHVYLPEVNPSDNYHIRVGNNPNADFNPVCGVAGLKGN